MRVPIRVKVVLAVVATMAVAGAAAVFLVRQLYERGSRAASEQALRGAAAAYEDLERADVAKLASTLEGLLAHPGLREAYLARDRARLLALAAPIFQGLKAEHGITHWYFLEPEPSKRCFLRVHAPAKFDDVIDRTTLARAIGKRETAAGKELGRTAFALRVVRPFAIDGKVVGYMELGEEIDHFLGRMKAQTGDDVAMFISKKHLDQAEWARVRGSARNNWNDWPDVVVVDSTTSERIVDASAISGDIATGRLLDESERDGSVFVRGAFPVRDASGQVVGGLVVRHDISALHAGMQAGILRALGFVALLTLVASALVYLLVDRLIFRRLKMMMSTMEDASECLAGGDYDVGKGLKPARQDEIGDFETFFGKFLRLIGTRLRGLTEQKREPARALGTVPAPRLRPM
jgi:Double sensory domain of two-component sensor kinase